jgi:hypothetical protein
MGDRARTACALGTHDRYDPAFGNAEPLRRLGNMGGDGIADFVSSGGRRLCGCAASVERDERQAGKENEGNAAAGTAPPQCC